MKYPETLKKILLATPTIEKRIEEAKSLIFIQDKSISDLVISKNADAVFMYNNSVFTGISSDGISFESLAETIGNDTLFVIHHLKSREITKQLRHMGFSRIMDVTHKDWRDSRLLDLELMKENWEKIETLFGWLDKASQEVLFGLILFRINNDPDALIFSAYPQYLHPEKRDFSNSVILDGGAFIGDSGATFLNNSRENCEVFCFEPDFENFNILSRNIRTHRLGNLMHPFPYGLWDSKTTLFFENASQSSRFTDKGSTAISTVDLDSFCAFHNLTPTAIKLDVEGAEINTLQGAGGIIKKHKPYMLVSLYHIAEHLWDIPAMLKNMHSDYKLHIGHHSPDLTIYETTLYAY